jgi:surface antigen
MDKADQQAMLEAIQRLNDHNPIMVGTTETWKGETSSGSVHLDRIFHHGGRDCRAMTYRVISHPAGATKLRHSTRQATWCRTGDGPWKEG